MEVVRRKCGFVHEIDVDVVGTRGFIIRLEGGGEFISKEFFESSH